MYALRYQLRGRAYGVFYMNLRFSHQVALINTQAHSFQPTPPPKPKNNSSADDMDDITGSLKRILITRSIIPSANQKATPEPTPKATPIFPNDRKPMWRRNLGRNMNRTPSRRSLKDPILPPSPASGGIPEPTAAYLAGSIEPLRRLDEAQHLLVVIDLNGTLLFRPNKRSPSKFIERPNTARFLRYCIDTFNVVIWSSARPENVKLMCDAILDQELKRKVVAIWARDMFGLSRCDYSSRTQCYKRLMRLWDDPKIAASHPTYEMGGRWDLRNTVLVDDSPEKGRSEPFNMIAIPEFFGDDNEPGQILPQVHDYVNSLSMHSNVAAYMRAHPFRAALPITTLPITTASIQYHG